MEPGGEEEGQTWQQTNKDEAEEPPPSRAEATGHGHQLQEPQGQQPQEPGQQEPQGPGHQEAQGPEGTPQT